MKSERTNVQDIELLARSYLRQTRANLRAVGVETLSARDDIRRNWRRQGIVSRHTEELILASVAPEYRTTPEQALIDKQTARHYRKVLDKLLTAVRANPVAYQILTYVSIEGVSFGDSRKLADLIHVDRTQIEAAKKVLRYASSHKLDRKHG